MDNIKETSILEERMEETVIVATVTYNSSGFLRRLVEAVAQLSYPVKKIVAVDNASTQEHKLKNEQLASEFPFLEIIESSENLGGAGGFEKGIRYILDRNYACDWIWIMDDDAFPQKDCLEALIKYKDLDNIGALCPLIYGNELKKFQLMHHKNMSRFLNYDCQAVNSVEQIDDVTEIQSNAFVGPLVKKNVVLDVGVPDGRLFIYGDDTEYMYRISRKYKVYLVKGAVINHRDVVEKQGAVNPKAYWKEYYKFRNRLLFVDEYGTSITKRFVGKFLIAKDILHYAAATFCKKKYRGIKGLRINCLIHALEDGLSGKSGKTLDPEEYYEKLNKISM